MNTHQNSVSYVQAEALGLYFIAELEAGSLETMSASDLIGYGLFED